MELFLARHGQTLSNAEKRHYGSGEDSPLSENGIEQAKLLGVSLEGLIFDAVYSSPLNRAIDTVNIALGNRYKIMIDERLTEINLGAMGGMTRDDASIKYPRSSTLMSDPISYIPPPNGENLDNMIERVTFFLDDIIKKNHNRIFVMTHGYVLRVLYACTIDKTISTIAKAPIYSNCELVRYTYEDKIWTLNRDIT